MTTNAQRLAGHVRTRCKSIAVVTVGEIERVGLDGGAEFGFTLTARNGAEYLVSVVETKAAPVEVGTKVKRVGNVIPTVMSRAERQRLRFLGEPVPPLRQGRNIREELRNRPK